MLGESTKYREQMMKELEPIRLERRQLKETWLQFSNTYRTGRKKRWWARTTGGMFAGKGFWLNKYVVDCIIGQNICSFSVGCFSPFLVPPWVRISCDFCCLMKCRHLEYGMGFAMNSSSFPPFPEGSQSGAGPSGPGAAHNVSKK